VKAPLTLRSCSSENSRATRKISQAGTGGRLVTATVHPSSILRAPDESRDAELKEFTRDLTLVAKQLDG
jgi:uracil-DNA glycosylase